MVALNAITPQCWRKGGRKETSMKVAYKTFVVEVSKEELYVLVYLIVLLLSKPSQ